MSIIILLTLGGTLGWCAGVLPGASRSLTVAAGMFGALLGGWLLVPLFGGGALSAEISGDSLAEGALGAIILIALVLLVRKGMSTEDSE